MLPLVNDPRPYAWGSTTLLADLQGRTPSDAPEAEIWFGTHPEDPAEINDGSSRRLDDYLTAEGGTSLPFLAKLLAAGSVLSLQVHPSKSEAEAGFAAEERTGPGRAAATRNYRDANHKPELIYALSDPFVALAGIRPLRRTHELLAELPANGGVAALRERLTGTDDATAVRDVLAWVFTPDAAAAVDDICTALAAAAGPEAAAEIREAADIARQYPGDPGIVVALLMNRVELRRGEAIFVDAGILHAYVRGLGVEIMAASDNVLRAGLTPKHIDVGELLRIANTTPAEVHPQPATKDGVWSVYSPVADFSLAVAEVRPEAAATRRTSGPTIVLSGGGRVRVSDGTGAVTLDPGTAAFASGGDGLRVEGEGLVFLASAGTPGS